MVFPVFSTFPLGERQESLMFSSGRDFSLGMMQIANLNCVNFILNVSEMTSSIVTVCSLEFVLWLDDFASFKFVLIQVSCK